MRIRPYSEMHTRQVEEILRAEGVGYVQVHSEDHVEDWRIRDRARTPAQYRNFIGLVENIFFEVEEAEVERLRDKLEPFGFVPASDGSFELGGPEEYFCPQCDFFSNEQRLCLSFYTSTLRTQRRPPAAVGSQDSATFAINQLRSFALARCSSGVP